MSDFNFNCVLLIDDDGVTNFINHRIIKKMNITNSIQSAMNGNDALKNLKDFSLKNENCCPELILLDINMPVFDGFEFLDQFDKINFKNKEKIKLIILTNTINQKEKVKLSKATYMAYITKPLTREKLIDALNNYKAIYKTGV